MLVFDLTRRNTFENCTAWLEEFKLSAKEDCEIVVVGNKLDLVSRDLSLRMVDTQEAQDFAEYEGFNYKEISALTAKNVDDTFLELLQKVHDKRGKHVGKNQDNEADQSILPKTLEENSEIRLDNKGVQRIKDKSLAKGCC